MAAGGGGHSGTEWIPTAKRQSGAEAVNDKFYAKKGGSQLQSKNQIRVVTCKMCVFSLYFVKSIMLIPCNLSK